MPLDPQCQALIDAIGGTEITDTSVVTPQQLRNSIRQMSAMSAPGPDMARVTNVRVPGPNGDIAVRTFGRRHDPWILRNDRDPRPGTRSCVVCWGGAQFPLVIFHSHR